MTAVEKLEDDLVKILANLSEIVIRQFGKKDFDEKSIMVLFHSKSAQILQALGERMRKLLQECATQKNDGIVYSTDWESPTAGEFVAWLQSQLKEGEKR